MDKIFKLLLKNMTEIDEFIFEDGIFYEEVSFWSRICSLVEYRPLVYFKELYFYLICPDLDGIRPLYRIKNFIWIITTSTIITVVPLVLLYERERVYYAKIFNKQLLRGFKS